MLSKCGSNTDITSPNTHGSVLPELVPLLSMAGEYEDFVKTRLAGEIKTTLVSTDFSPTT